MSANGISRNKKSSASYIISISVYAGCYRHIRISANATLLTLHQAIIDVFGFSGDHAHAFFMDNRKWGDDGYYAERVEDMVKITRDYRLYEVIYPGLSFKYLFDFGDEWLFQCKVLREITEATDKPLVVREKGVLPEQYGRDESWFEDESFDE